MNTGPVQRKGEAAIRQRVQYMQDGQNARNGELFASAFTQDHDYVAINGTFSPNHTPRDNARIHKWLYDDSRCSVAGKHPEVDVRPNVSTIRPLTPEVAVVHVRSEFRPRSDPDRKTENIITAVTRRRDGEWEIVSFHNAPVQKRKRPDS
jgi:uncharacterized protein (TIGR02246 family)